MAPRVLISDALSPAAVAIFKERGIDADFQPGLGKNKDKLASILTYHVVAGTMTTKDLREKIKAGGGKAELKTVEGKPLTITEKDGHVWLTDEKGDKAEITIANVMQSNGVTQVINTVMLPG